MEQFERIPVELLINEILPQMRLGDLLNLCQTDKYINQLCRNEKVWQLKLQHDFPNISHDHSDNWRDLYFYLESGVYTDYPDAPPKPNNISWRQYHRLLSCSYIHPIKYVGLKFPGTNLGYVFIIPTITTFKSFLTQINNLLMKNKLDYNYYNIRINDEFTIFNLNGSIYSPITSDQFIHIVPNIVEILVRFTSPLSPIAKLIKAMPNLNILLLPTCSHEDLNDLSSNLNFTQYSYKVNIGLLDI